MGGNTLSDKKPYEITGNSKYHFMLGWVSELPAGQAHVATKGNQYTCKSESFCQVVYTVARQKDYAATVSVFQGHVVFAFYQRTAYMRPNLQAYPVVKKMRGE